MTEEITKFRIIKILKKFNLKEISDFEKFLNSSFDGHYRTLKKLFKILKPYYPDFDSTIPSRKAIFLKISRLKVYDYKLFNKYMSDLSKLAEEFIVSSEFKVQTEEKNIYLLNYYRKKDQNDLFRQTLNRIEINGSTDSSAGKDIFLNNHKIEHIKGNYYFKTQKPELQFGSIIKSQNNLMKYFLGLSTFYFKCLYVHKYSFKNYIDKNLVSEFWNNFDFENFIKNVDLESREKDLLTLDYYNVLLSLKEDDFLLYRKMKKKLLGCYDNLSKQAQYEFFSSLNSYCIIKIAHGNVSLERELFENFRFMLEENLYESGNEKNINITEYRAIMKSALRVNEIEWGEYFINNYKNFIEANTRETVYQYGNALLQFAKGNYTDSLKLISDLKILNHSMRTDLYVLTLVNYYELGYYDLTNSVIDSFKHFLKENKYVSNELAKGNLKFMQYYKILFGLKRRPDVKKSNELLITINNSKSFLADKKWLLVKVNEQLISVRSFGNDYSKAKLSIKKLSSHY